MIQTRQSSTNEYDALLAIIESGNSLSVRQGAAQRIARLIAHNDFFPGDLENRLRRLYSSASDVRIATSLLRARNSLTLKRRSFFPPGRQTSAADPDNPELEQALERLRSLHDADKTDSSTLDALFEIDSLICEGGMGRVFKGTDRSGEQTVAIKFLADIFLGDKSVRQRFEREYRLLSALNHPGVIRVLDFGADDHQCYIVMEYAEGGDLAVMVREQNLNPELLLDIFIQVCSALEAVHEKGIVHRDIKPSNILIKKSEEILTAKLTDFGLARDPENNGLTRCDNRIGTMSFSSPEQISNPAAVGPAADIYSLGVTMYYAFSRGRHPAGDYQELEMYRRDVPPEMNRIVAQCIRRKPADRWDSAAQIGKHLMEIRDL